MKALPPPLPALPPPLPPLPALPPPLPALPPPLPALPPPPPLSSQPCVTTAPHRRPANTRIKGRFVFFTAATIAARSRRAQATTGPYRIAPVADGRRCRQS